MHREITHQLWRELTSHRIYICQMYNSMPAAIDLLNALHTLIKHLNDSSTYGRNIFPYLVSTTFLPFFSNKTRAKLLLQL